MSEKFTLRDILSLYSTEGLPDRWSAWDDIRPNSVYRVKIAFMSEDETHIETYATHPILIPYYDCRVDNIDVDDKKFTLRVWVDYESFMPNLIKRNREGD